MTRTCQESWQGHRGSRLSRDAQTPSPQTLPPVPPGGGKAFQGQSRDKVPPACPGPPPSVICLEASNTDARTTSTPLNVEEQWLFSELLSDGRATHSISKGVPGHPVEESHFSCFYPGFFQS
ncbi:hypothetical protein CRENBAI_007948 [Crenichthys baileyi]|uniref:Uncharacterized protein n=1 Tax=Crenichthys baileyi TaxID=28760 RepID=A0AAV9R3R8_9TELE